MSLIIGVITLVTAITLSNILSSYSSATKLNSNFQAITSAFQDTISKTTGGIMQTDIDMNSNTLINLGDPIDGHNAATKDYVDGVVEAVTGVDVSLFVTDAELDAAITASRAQGVIWTATYATLSAITTNLTFGQTFYTGARTSGGDGGAGEWYYRTDRPFTPDGGTVINCTAGGQFVRIRDFLHFDASWYGVVGGNTAALNTAAFQACTAAMVAAGAGKMTCSGGSQANLLIYPTGTVWDGTKFLGNFTNMSHVEIDLTGKILYVEDTLIANEFQRVFQFSNCDNIRVTASVKHVSHSTHTTDRGVDWFYVIGPCKKSYFDVTAVGGYTGVDYARNNADNETYTPSGIHIVNLHSTDTSYPCSIQNAVHGLDLTLWAIRPVRSFLNHGHIGRLKAKITSIDPYTQDVLLHSDGQSTHDQTGAEPRDWDIDYYRRANSGAVSPVSSYSMALGFRGNSHSHHWRRLKIKAYVESLTDTAAAPALYFFAQDDASVDITLLASMPAIVVDDLDVDVFVANATGNNAAVDLFYHAKWDNTVIKRAKLNAYVIGASGTPLITHSWTPFRVVTEHNLTAPGTLFMNQRPTVNGLNEASFSFNGANPTWKGDTADPAIGNGSIVGYLTRQDDWYNVDIKVTMGSTTTYGTGAWYFTLPAPFNGNARVEAIGTALCVDAGTTRTVGVAYIAGGTNKIYVIPPTGTTNVAATVPHTWANTDVLYIRISYLRTY